MRRRLILLLVIVFTLPLVRSAHTEDRRLPAIRARADTQELWCWYVERNSVGKHGYAAQDARLGSFMPDSTELFESIASFKAALRAKGLSHVRLSTSAPIIRPPPFIRPPTDAEMKQLRE